MPVPGAQQLGQRHQVGQSTAEQFAVNRRQPVPGHGSAFMVGVVIAEIEREQVESRPARRDHVGVGVGLLVDAVTPVHGHRLGRLNEELIKRVVKGVEKIEHMQQQRISHCVQQQRLERPRAQARQQGAPDQQHGRRTWQVPALGRDEERPGDDLPVHEDLGGRDVGPFERAQHAFERGAALHQALEIKAGDIGAVAVMADVHVADALERGVARPGDEAHPFTDAAVGCRRGKQRVVRRLVHQIGGQHHGVHAQQHAQHVEPHRCCAHQPERCGPAQGGP